MIDRHHRQPGLCKLYDLGLKEIHTCYNDSVNIPIEAMLQVGHSVHL